jgi:hypothetical protein
MQGPWHVMESAESLITSIEICRIHQVHPYALPKEHESAQPMLNVRWLLVGRNGLRAKE